MTSGAGAGAKPTVFYDSTKYNWIKVGHGAIVCPINHPDTEHVSNQSFARTTEVLTYSPETGEFETKNTLYKPN